MVSHGLLTGAMFLLAGVLYERGGTYEMSSYGGLAGNAPKFALLMAFAVFGSLGLPGFSGFIAEFQIFAGSLGAAPVPTALALLGIIITAALMLRMLQRIFLGGSEQPAIASVHDALPRELIAIAPLLLLAVVIGVFPRFLLDIVDPAARAVTFLVSR